MPSDYGTKIIDDSKFDENVAKCIQTKHCN